MAQNQPMKYALRQPREGKAIATIQDKATYLLLGKDREGRAIYTLKERSGFYYALAEGMKIAWRVVPVKPTMTLPDEVKRPKRRNRAPRSRNTVKSKS